MRKANQRYASPMIVQVRAATRSRSVEAPVFAKKCFFITSSTQYRANFRQESSRRAGIFRATMRVAPKCGKQKVNCARVNCGVTAILAQDRLGNALRRESTLTRT